MDTCYVPVIAIDGPSGSGKSTIAQLIALELNIQYIDTGALYRALGYWAHQEHWELTVPETLALQLQQLTLSYGHGPDCLIAINGANLTTLIRQHFVSQLASDISRLSVVRDFLLDFQRQLAAKRPSVMEGRDIGTVIFPRAFCKIFLTASAQERARRRCSELQAKGQPVDYQQIYQDLVVRDANDTVRASAPLRQAEDAVLLDSTNLTRQEVVAVILAQAQERRAKTQVPWHN